MSEISRWLTTLLLNAIWQITAITICAFVCAKFLRRLPSRYAHRAWVLAMFACLLIPLMTVLIQHRAGTGIEETKRAESVLNEPLNSSSRGLSLPFHSLSHSISVPPILSRILPWAFAALLLYRAVWLVWMVYRTNRIRQCAYEREMPASLSEVAERCLREFSLSAVPLLCSTEVSSPATVGFTRPVLLLPESFFTSSLTQDDFSSALSHEFAHVQRCDFVLNLVYESVYLAVCFHPFTAYMRSRIAHTRELVCDEIAARMLPSGARYASSLLHIAQSMSSGGRLQSTYALGLFDTNALEERIVNILKTTNVSRNWARALRLVVVSLVGAVALGISVFSLKLAAENATDLRQFAGTWKCKYKGRPFFTLKMAVEDGVLGGTAVHSISMSGVDGEIVPDTDKTTQDKIFDTHASGQELLIKIADGPDNSDPISLSFKLTGKDEAEAKLIVEKQSDAPPQKKSWHFQRISNAQ